MPAPHDELIELERRGWEALSASGEAACAFYEQILDRRPVMLLPGGMVLDERPAVVASMAGAPWSRYVLDDVRCLPLGDDTAAVVYGAVAERDGHGYSALMSSVYVRREGGWKLALHQQTPRES